MGDVQKGIFDRFFPREKKEDKVKEFINLRQEGMSVKEYSLKFIKLSKYASSLVSNDRDEMSRYVKGVSEDLEEECRASMLHENMDRSKLMVHAQQVEDSCIRKKNRDAKKAKSLESSSSKSRLDVKDKPNLRRGFQISFLLISPRIAIIEILILNLKKEEMLIHQKRDQLVVSVVTNIWVDVLLELIVDMVVERVAIW